MGSEMCIRDRHRPPYRVFSDEVNLPSNVVFLQTNCLNVTINRFAKKRGKFVPLWPKILCSYEKLMPTSNVHYIPGQSDMGLLRGDA